MADIVLYAVAITALVVSDVLLVVLGWRAWRARSAPVSTDDKVAQEIKALACSVGLLAERLARIETQLSRQLEREEQRPPRKEGDHKAFEVASKMASQGANVDEIVSLCGLTRGEAELIHQLHGNKLN